MQPLGSLGRSVKFTIFIPITWQFCYLVIYLKDPLKVSIATQCAAIGRNISLKDPQVLNQVNGLER